MLDRAQDDFARPDCDLKNGGDRRQHFDDVFHLLRRLGIAGDEADRRHDYEIIGRLADRPADDRRPAAGRSIGPAQPRAQSPERIERGDDRDADHGCDDDLQPIDLKPVRRGGEEIVELCLQIRRAARVMWLARSGGGGGIGGNHRFLVRLPSACLRWPPQERRSSRARRAKGIWRCGAT